jgi:hypothetical protein
VEEHQEDQVEEEELRLQDQDPTAEQEIHHQLVHLKEIQEEQEQIQLLFRWRRRWS